MDDLIDEFPRCTWAVVARRKTSTGDVLTNTSRHDSEGSATAYARRMRDNGWRVGVFVGLVDREEKRS